MKPPLATMEYMGESFTVSQSTRKRWPNEVFCLRHGRVICAVFSATTPLDEVLVLWRQWFVIAFPAGKEQSFKAALDRVHAAGGVKL